MPAIQISEHALIVSSMQRPKAVDPVVLLRQMGAGKVEPHPDPDRLIVPTGVWGGPVQVETEFLDSRPAALLNGWEDVEEYSMQLEAGLVTLSAHEVLPVVVGEIAGNVPLNYRVRVNVSGRDTHYDLITEEVEESYLIQFWPAPHEPAAQLRAGSVRGAEMFEARMRLH